MHSFRQCFFSKEHPIVIRPLQGEDIPQLALLARQTYVETYQHGYFTPKVLDGMFGDQYIYGQVPSELARGSCIYFLCHHNKQLVGYAKVVFQNEAAFLDKLYVLKKHHGRGFGHRLLWRCFDAAISNGKTKMTLIVYDQNEKAINFYRRHGFYIHGGKEEYIVPVDNVRTGKYNVEMLCNDIVAAKKLGARTYEHTLAVR